MSAPFRPQNLLPNMTLAKPQLPREPIGWPWLPLPSKADGTLEYPSFAESLKQQIQIILLTGANQQLMLRVAEAQSGLGPALQRLSDAQGGDEISRTHLRAIEQTLGRILSDSQQGRTAAMNEMRGDIRILTRTIAALAEAPR